MHIYMYACEDVMKRKENDPVLINEENSVSIQQYYRPTHLNKPLVEGL